MEEEAVRIIKVGPRWVPAMQNGKKVNAIMSQPITFIVVNNSELTKSKSTLTVPLGLLDCVVKSGSLSTPFGEYTIEGTKLVGNNPGITIRGEKGSKALSTQDGTILAVFNLGETMGIVVGDKSTETTTYSNLGNVAVTKGQKITKGDVLGEISKDDNSDNYTLDFLVLRKTQAIDPLEWLKNQ